MEEQSECLPLIGRIESYSLSMTLFPKRRLLFYFWTRQHLCGREVQHYHVDAI